MQALNLISYQNLQYKMNQYDQIEDFLNDPGFMAWAKSGENASFWSEYARNNPSKAEVFNDAVALVRSTEEKKSSLSADEVKQMWSNLEQELDSRKKPGGINQLLRYSSVAVLILGITITSLIYFRHNQFQNYFSEFDLSAETDVACLVLGDGSTIDLTDHSVVSYAMAGKELLIDSVPYKQIELAENTSKNKHEKLNQLIVPNGKRSFINLPDGSKVWLNSGSRLVYPDSFEGKKNRELALQGEAFFEVHANKQQPFIVHTDALDVVATGTRFNVKAYENESEIETVLAEGKVDVLTTGFNLFGANKESLNPNQKLVFTRGSSEMKLAVANVEHATSWIDGFLVFEREPLESVLQRVARYYNVHFHLDDEKVSTYTISGKLYLKDSINTILRIIADIVPVNYTLNESEIHLTGKNS